MAITNVYANLTDFIARQRIAATDTTLIGLAGLWLEAASRQIDEYCGRKFYTTVETRYLTPALELMVDVEADLVSVTTLKTDPSGARVYDVTWSSTDYDLWPDNARNHTPAKPYLALKVTPFTTQYFPRIARGVQIVGSFGYSDQKVAVSTLTAGVDASTVTIPVASGALFKVAQIIRVDAEDMALDAISSNNLTVRRGMNGTTAASHLSAAVVSAYTFGAIEEATHMLASRLKQRKDTPLGVSANTLLGQLTVKAPKDEDILALLEGYRRLI